MSKKKIGIVIAAVTVALIAAVGIILYRQSFYDEYVPTDDEIVLRMQLDTEETSQNYGL